MGTSAFGDFLRFYRSRIPLTQEELAEKSGISVRTIQRIEAGQSPKGYTLKALIKALEVEEIDLVTVAPMEMENSEVLKWNKIINFSALPLLLIPLTPLGTLFGFVVPPPGFYLFLVAAVATYLLLVEIVKQWFYRAYARRVPAKAVRR